MSDSFVTPWSVASSVHGISQARILALPFPSPGDLPDPATEPTCAALAGKFFTTEPPGKAEQHGTGTKTDTQISGAEQTAQK